MCGQSDKNVQLPVRPRGLIDVRRKFNLLLHPIVICRLTIDGMQGVLYQNLLCGCGVCRSTKDTTEVMSLSLLFIFISL